MNQGTTWASQEVSFKEFLIKNKKNRTTLWFVAIAIVIQFGIFKYFYPYASYIHGDSFSYLNAASKNLAINTYMVGYSNFLRLLSVLTKSDIFLTAFQYLLIHFGALCMLFSIYYFYSPSRVLQYLLLTFMTFNPLFLHLANLVSSDCIFTALSLVWFTSLLWIIHKPSTKIIVWHTVLLFVVFTIRYNALIYPFLSIAAFTLSPLHLHKRLIGAVASLLFCGLFIGYTSFKYKKLTGYWQYSPFSGWQLTNNAMYAYRYVDSLKRKPVKKEFVAFDNMLRAYFDSTRDTQKFPIEAVKASTYYMWSPGLPMFKYRDSLFNNNKKASELKKWASMGPFYKSYGLYIIRQYPLHFMENFIWPNSLKYYAPPVEFLENYNSGKDSVAPIAKEWFDYSSRKVVTRFKNKQTITLDFYPIFSGIINAIMFFLLIFYSMLKGWKNAPMLQKGVLLGTTIWVLNAFFTIFASSAALRFQSFPITLTTMFTCLLLDWLWKSALKPDVLQLNFENKDLTIAQ
ncbi:hypothetical protein FAM09_26100 [Niastella caeni]|uniref:Uncharacterized protein n=1 Tax=Niastella caeni TaxID=2569763 RepID=A0A4S8HDR2_9BACT|nr:hypothetical protein [Niastella caeni]THU32925.1 hypothetical protein FAM09_26100 [Niastella caeni]